MSLQTGLLPRSYFLSRRSVATTPLSEPRLSRSHAQAGGASNYHHGQTHARRSREVRSAIVARATEARRRRPHWSRGIPGGATTPLLIDYYFCSATSRAAAPLVVDDHLGSAASRAAAPLIVDNHLGSAAGGAAAPLVPIILTPIWLQAWIAGCPLTEPGQRAVAGTLRGAEADIILAHEEPPQNDNTDMAFYERPTTSATAPSWLALHIQAQRFKPNTDSTMTLPRRRQGHK